MTGRGLFSTQGGVEDEAGMLQRNEVGTTERGALHILRTIDPLEAGWCGRLCFCLSRPRRAARSPADFATLTLED